ncbi:hypothetical protein CRUP_035063, partial [Coryphaenoides rupestris]
MHTHVTMGSSPEVLSWTSCPGLLVGKLKEELKLSVVGDVMKNTAAPAAPNFQTPATPPEGPPPQIITDLAPPPPPPSPPPPPPVKLCVPPQQQPPHAAGGQDEEYALGGVTPPYAALNEDSVRSDGGHFDNTVLQLREQEEAQEEAASPASCEHGGSGGEEHTCDKRPAERTGEQRYHHHHHPDDIKLHFHRAGPGSGGFLEGLFGCLRPVWNIIGKTYSTDYKLQQQAGVLVRSANIPYKDVDSSAIIWGVGSNSLHLPVPSTCPDGFKILMKQTWQSKPRNRPSFRQILLHLDIAAADILGAPQETYFKSQAEWREEVKKHFEKIKSEGTCIHRLDEELIRRRRDELRHALDIREHYERKLERANNLYMELSAIMLQLEVREKELMKREQAVEKKYPGNYKRQLVRPIVRPNAVEKLIKKKGSLSHKPGLPQAKSPKLSTPPGKARYRSKPRHRRASSKGSHNDFPGVLKASQESLHHPRPAPPEGPLLPLKGREQAVVNCANNLRYFGPAAALRSPQTDHLQRRVACSSPDLIASTGVDSDSRQRAPTTASGPVAPPPPPGPTAGSLGPCCQVQPFPADCQDTAWGSGQPELLEQRENGSPSLPPQLPAPVVPQPTQDGDAADKPQPGGHALPSALPRILRPLRKSYSTFSSENLSATDGEEGNTSDHSHSGGPPGGLSASQEEHLDDLLSHTPDLPIDISTQSDGLSDKECAVRRVKTQISLGKLCADEHSYELPSTAATSTTTITIESCSIQA